MGQKLFSEINARLIEKLANDDTYQGQLFNYYKLFQHGVVYAINTSKNKTQRTYFHLPIWLQKLRFSLKKDPIEWSDYLLEKYVWLEPARVFKSSENDIRSMYGYKLKATLGHALTTVQIRKQHPIVCDYDISSIDAEGGKLDAIENALFNDLVAVARKLKRSNHYNDLEKKYILSSLHVFFAQFRKYHKLFRNKKTERLFYIVHYHNEAISAACRLNQIEAVEMQHGLINKNDLYYVYDPHLKPCLANALFPDKILLYGEYWKNVLRKGAEWSPEQLVVAGNYLAMDDQNIRNDQKENLIIVATQKGMHQQYIPLIQSLLQQIEHFPDWNIIVKLHPTEKEPEAYMALRHKQLSLAEKSSNIQDLLHRAKMQISIYSTTFFDAAGLEVMNFSWVTKGVGSDYAASLVEENVAIALKSDTCPIVYYLENHQTYSYLQREAIYAPLDPSKFLS